MSDRVTLEKLPPVVSAMEENLHGHIAFLQRRLPAMTVDDREDLLLVDSGLPTDTFNKICRARLRDTEADRRIAEALEHFRGAGRPFAWWVGPGSRPFDIEARLRAQGLKAFESELGMAMEMTHLTRRADSTSELEVRRVDTERDLEDFVGVLDACGDPPDPSVGDFFRATAPALLEDDGPMRLFVGYADGQPVATSELFTGGDVAGVHMVATHPRYRRRGFGWRLTWAALDEGRRLGLDTATLQASPQGESVYRRLRFRAVCRFVEYQ